MDMGLAEIMKAEYGEVAEEETAVMPELATQAELDAYIGKLETEMREAARKFEFERAARLRDSIKELREKEFLFGRELTRRSLLLPSSSTDRAPDSEPI